MNEVVRVLLVDDHPIVRHGVKAVLALDDHIDVVADVGSIAEMMPHLDHVDVVVMDLQLGPASTGELDGIRATRTITANRVGDGGTPRVLVLTTYDNDADVLAAIDAGAGGYILKSASPSELIDAVLQTHRGQSALTPRIAGRLVQRSRQSDTALTARELEVLALVASGHSNQAIAGELFLSQATVKTHLAHTFGKLDVTSRTAAVARATEIGLLRR